MMEQLRQTNSYPENGGCGWNLLRVAEDEVTMREFVHEISNPLNGIYTTVQVLQRYFKMHDHGDDRITSTIEALSEEVQRLKQLLEEFRRSARPDSLNLQRLDLAAVVVEVLAMEAPNYGERGIELENEFPYGLPPVVIDRDKIKQVILNLCKNAVDAMSEGGKLTLRGHRSGSRILLEVVDTGRGIPEGSRVFEPCATLKPGGLGLGLSIVKRIVSAHGGRVRYHSKPGWGTQFTVELPMNPMHLGCHAKA